MNSMRSRAIAMVAVLVALTSAPVLADDLSGSNLLLCSPAQATVCTFDEGECQTGLPWEWNIPSFVHVDLEKKEVRTTPTAAEQRITPFQQVLRQSGVILFQGFELGRAFSFVIDEATGDASVAIAREGVTISIFAECIPQ